MAKFFGKIGFAEFVTVDGITTENVIERCYYGDVTRNTRKLESSGHLNDNVNVGNTISIVADPYANLNFFSMRYIEWMNAKWKITDVDVQYPRLILTIGGLYNGNQAGT